MLSISTFDHETPVTDVDLDLEITSLDELVGSEPERVPASTRPIAGCP
jgi:hypothetical protein